LIEVRFCFQSQLVTTMSDEFREVMRVLGVNKNKGLSEEEEMEEIIRKMELGDVDVEQALASVSAKRTAREKDCKKKAKTAPLVFLTWVMLTGKPGSHLHSLNAGWID